MDNLGELREAVQSDLNVSSNSSLYPQATIDSAINRSHRKCGGLFKWPILQDALTTTSQANIDYYDAPETWQPRSLWRLTVNGTPYGIKPDYSPQVYKDFLDWLDNSNSDLTEKRWAVQWRRYFINPAPATAGLTICVWGLKNVTKLTLDADETIFTNNLPECNEAVVLEASAILKKKGELPQDGLMFSQEAKQILVVAFGKIKQESGKYEKVYPFLNVPNFYNNGGSPVIDKTGRF